MITFTTDQQLKLFVINQVEDVLRERGVLEALDKAKLLIDNVDAACNLIYVDPHQWSTRPCSTCTQVTSLIGKEFGCVRYWKENPTR